MNTEKPPVASTSEFGSHVPPFLSAKFEKADPRQAEDGALFGAQTSAPRYAAEAGTMDGAFGYCLSCFFKQPSLF